MKYTSFITISFLILSVILCEMDISEKELEETLERLQQHEDEHNQFEQHLNDEIMSIIKEKGYEGKEYLIKDEFKNVFLKLLLKESKEDSIEEIKEDDETLTVLAEKVANAMPDKIYIHNVTSYFNSDKMVSVLMGLLGQFNLDDVLGNKKENVNDNNESDL